MAINYVMFKCDDDGRKIGDPVGVWSLVDPVPDSEFLNRAMAVTKFLAENEDADFRVKGDAGWYTAILMDTEEVEATLRELEKSLKAWLWVSWQNKA
jgi:hypothetical protein